MFRTTALVLVAAGIAPVASADFVTLTTEVSVDGTTWSSSVGANPGTTVNVRYLASWGRNAGLPAVAFGGFTMLQINVSGSSSGDVASNFAGIIRPTTQTFAMFNAGTPSAKIDRLDNTTPAAGIQLAQLPVDSGGLTDNPLLVFSYDYTVSLGAPDGPITFDVLQSQINLAIIFTTTSGSSVLVPSSNRLVTPATINVAIPAVGGLPVACAAGLLASRRRR